MGDIVLIKHGKDWGLSTKFVRSEVLRILRLKYNGGPALVSINFVGRTRALKFNLDYRQKNYVPQVLGFPMLPHKADIDGITRLGDILICTPLMKEECLLYNKRMNQVLTEWIDHGIENLLKPSTEFVKGLISVKN